MSATVTYDFSSVPTIESFVNDRHRYKYIQGPFGSGKSSGCVIHLLLAASQQEPSEDKIRYTRFAIIRNTLKELVDTTKKQ